MYVSFTLTANNYVFLSIATKEIFELIMIITFPKLPELSVVMNSINERLQLNKHLAKYKSYDMIVEK